MTLQPAGTVTLVFTDIEGSTRLLQELGTEAYRAALASHREHVRGAFTRQGGYEVNYEGDSFFYSFASAQSALEAVSEAMRALSDGPIRIRVGIHTGEPGLDPPKYVGLDVHQTARIMSAAHGGQVLVSERTRAALPAQGFPLKPLGEYRLKDLLAPEPLYQLELAGLHDSFPPLKALYNANLPTQPSPLVGRQRELAELGELLCKTRLLTLTGPGGTGKTRLALQLAAEVVERFAAGAHFVPLAPLSEPTLLASAIASVLGVKEGAGQTLEEALLEHLRDRSLLLLVDNLEHLLQAAPLLARLLEAAPKLTMLATSRERLGLRGEQEYCVPPLTQAEAVSLFAERAAALKPDFNLERERVHLEAIVERLDHLPLALELAAARTKLLPPAKLLERLEHRLPLLTGGARDAPARQRTLRATIEWSYQLLSAQEQTLFRRLAVFAGGFALEAAEQICTAELDTLASLVDKSLVRASEREGRLFLLETIREYADAVLQASGEGDGMRGRHAEWLAELVERLQPELDAGKREAFETLAADEANLRAALAWTRDGARSELMLGLASNSQDFWIARGQLQEGRAWLAQALEQADSSQSRERVWALVGMAAFARMQGDIATTESYAREGLELARRAKSCRSVIQCLAGLAFVAVTRGERARALALAEEAVQFARAEGNAHENAVALADAGNTALQLGEWERARELSLKAARLLRELDDAWARAIVLHNAATAALRMPCDEQAAQLANESFGLSLQANMPLMVAYDAELLALVAARRGDGVRCARLLGKAHSLFGPAGLLREPAEQATNAEAVALCRTLLAEAELEKQFQLGARMPTEALAPQLPPAGDTAASQSTS